MVAILGTPVGDLIPGTLSDGQTITDLQLIGDDTLVGREGSDQIFGLQGNDLLFGDAGQDILLGNQGNDTVFGGIENDSAYGGQDNDVIYGNLGADILFGDKGNDTIFGGKENDTIFGGRENDLLLGDLGDDSISGDYGSDTMSGGGGNDTFAIGRRSTPNSPTATTGGPLIPDADCINDFRVTGNDLIELQGGLTFGDLQFIDGTGSNGNGIALGDTMIRDTGTGEFLVVIKDMDAATLQANPPWFISSGGTTVSPTPTPTTPTPTPAGSTTDSFSFSTLNYTVNEGSVATITVNRTGNTSVAGSINYAALDGTALSGGSTPDYTPASGVLSFAPGETSKTFTVTALTDAITEGPEGVNLILSGGNVGSLPAILTINDVAGTTVTPTPTPTPTPTGTTVTPTPSSTTEFFFDSASYTVDRALGKATITVDRTGDLSVAGSITYLTVDGTAFATDPDFISVSGLLNFAPGQSSATFDVLINPNNPTVGGNPETVNLVLNGGTIRNPNPAILNLLGGGGLTGDTFQFGSTGIDLQTGGTITVTRVGNLAAPASIQYTFGAGNASLFSDYTISPPPGSLSFAAGQSSVSISVLDAVAGSQGEVATLVLFGGNLGAQASNQIVNI